MICVRNEICKQDVIAVFCAVFLTLLYLGGIAERISDILPAIATNATVAWSVGPSLCLLRLCLFHVNVCT